MRDLQVSPISWDRDEVSCTEALYFRFSEGSSQFTAIQCVSMSHVVVFTWRKYWKLSSVKSNVLSFCWFCLSHAQYMGQTTQLLTYVQYSIKSRKCTTTLVSKGGVRENVKKIIEHRDPASSSASLSHPISSSITKIKQQVKDHADVREPRL